MLRRPTWEHAPFFRGQEKGFEKKFLFVLLSFLLLLFGFSPPLVAQVFIWNNSGTGSWNEGGNWTPAGVPSETGFAQINNGGTAEITGVTSVFQLTLGSGMGESGHVFVQGAGRTLTINDVYVGEAGYGRLRIEAGGKVSSMIGILGQIQNSEGVVTVTGMGSAWENSSTLVIGAVGKGTVRVEAGGKVSSMTGILGQVQNSEGVVTVTGVGSAWENSGDLVIGNLGKGTVRIEAGGKISNGIGILGQIQNSEGVVTVTGVGSAWENSGDLVIGNLGKGTVRIEAGGKVSNGIGILGQIQNSEGVVTVTGVGSAWENSDDLVIGNLGKGTVRVEAGGKVSNRNGTLGQIQDSEGVVTVTGVGSAWENSGNLAIGNLGKGTVTIADGGYVHASDVHLGGLVFSEGTLNLMGTTGSRGVLETGFLEKGVGTTQLNWNGGILRAISDETDFFRNLSSADINLLGEGAFFDTQSFMVGIQTVLAGVGGVTKSGDGVLTLGAVNTYAGTTTVEQGTLLVEGSLTSSSTVVKDGAILEGSGAIYKDVVIENGGILMPGSSPGVLTVGELTLQTGSFTQFELNSPLGTPGVDSDLVVVTDTYGGSGDLTI